MAGARIHIEIDDDKAQAALNRLIAAGTDTTPLMKDIGEYLLRTTKDRFVEQKAPNGTPWAALSSATKKRKKRNAEKILTESGILRGQLTFQVGPDSVLVGSPTIYAGTHQFGASKGAYGTTSKGAPIPWGDIPARPFLGLSGDDATEIEALVNRYVAEQLP